MKQNIALILVISLFIHESQQTTCSDGRAQANGTADDGGDTTKCVNCLDGYYAPNTSGSTCSKCSAGYSGNGSLLIANAGQNDACKQCKKSTYAAEGTSKTTGCTKCSGNTSTNGDGAKSAEECTYCLNGYFSSNAAGGKYCDKPCPAGKVGKGQQSQSTATEDSSCQACETGKWSDEGSSGDVGCTKCLDGYYSTTADNKCDAKCPAGQVGVGVTANSASSKDVACKNCDAGKYSDEGTKSTDGCKSCADGTWSNAGDKTCTLCADGWFSSNNSSCDKKCPAGYIGKATNLIASANQDAQCKKCAPGTFSSEGTKSTFNCTNCEKGYWSNEGSAKCDQCADGYYSDDKSTCKPCEANTIGKGVNAMASAAKATVCVPCASGLTSPEGNPSTKACVAHSLLLGFSLLFFLLIGLFV